MKFLVSLLALTSVVLTAPQPKKIFHENYEDFANLIIMHAGDEIGQVTIQYFQHQEFLDTLEYLSTADFKSLMYEMEDLPEFRNVVDYLESHNVDITYFIDTFNVGLEGTDDRTRSSRQEISGVDYNSYLKDIMALYPKAELTALYDQKMVEDEHFRAAMEDLQSEEWKQVYDALWDSEVFQAEVKTLADNGIDINLMINSLIATFGLDVNNNI